MLLLDVLSEFDEALEWQAPDEDPLLNAEVSPPPWPAALLAEPVVGH